MKKAIEDFKTLEATKQLSDFIVDLLVSVITIDKNKDGKIQFFAEALPVAMSISSQAFAVFKALPNIKTEIAKEGVEEVVEESVNRFISTFDVPNEKIEHFTKNVILAVKHILLAIFSLHNPNNVRTGTLQG